MGSVAFAAKITRTVHVPVGAGWPPQGLPAGGDRPPGNIPPLPELGVDTIVVFDTHWLVNRLSHQQCGPFQGYLHQQRVTRFIKNMPYEYDGNTVLGDIIAAGCNEAGVNTRAHSDTTWLWKSARWCPCVT